MTLRYELLRLGILRWPSFTNGCKQILKIVQFSLVLTTMAASKFSEVSARGPVPYKGMFC
jgi:hypothetical protein